MRKSIIRRHRERGEIPTASTADIAFLLILFFMVTTVFRATKLNLRITIPEARSTERILMRRNVSYIWVDIERKIYLDDNVIAAEMIAGKMAQKVWENPELITVMKVDKTAEYGVVDDILDQLKEAKAFRITFATEQRS
ncbi:MAG: biopolymer transporter ExbD [candidate division WOR-3 bacterium]|nr:MAG: biopolymer transporter ExbD [candidate division WOR-3 bacterium]